MIPLVLACLLASLAGRPAASPTPTLPDTLALNDVLELARRHNPALVRARGDVAAARAERRAAWAAFLPLVDAATSFDVTRVRRYTTTDVFGDPAEREEAVEAISRGASQGGPVSSTRQMV